MTTRMNIFQKKKARSHENLILAKIQFGLNVWSFVRSVNDQRFEFNPETYPSSGRADPILNRTY